MTTPSASPASAATGAATTGPARPDARMLERRRHAMVLELFASRRVRNARILGALRRVPREVFLPEARWNDAYDLDAGWPSIASMAMMLEAARLERWHRVLEAGTGDGYGTALLLELGTEVFSIDTDAGSVRSAAGCLMRLGYEPAHLRDHDPREGWPEHGPFDAIVIPDVVDEVPTGVVAQLAPGGRLVAWMRRDDGPARLVVYARSESEDEFDLDYAVWHRVVPTTEHEGDDARGRP